MRRAILIAVVGCGSGSHPPAPTPQPPPPPPPVTPVVDEQTKRDEIVAAHRKLEQEEQEALAATCTDPKAKHARCEPSCYAAEAPDPRANKKVHGAVEIQHTVCQRVVNGSPDGSFFILDELDASKLTVREARAKKAHGKGTWQNDVETALAADAIVVTGTFRDVTHPGTNEKLRCVAASHFGTIRRALDGCGATGDVVCEAGGNAAAHGLDVVRYRLAEARKLQATDTAGCQQAALEAIAVARGLPRWRQYAKVNVDQWPKNARFRTRYDGTLDEDALFTLAASLGSDAEVIYAACGGSTVKTTPEQEQSFHTCW